MIRLVKIISVVSLLILISCSEDAMDKVNENQNYPNEVESKYLLTDAMVSTAFYVAGGDLAYYASVFCEYHVGCVGQLYNAEIRTDELKSSSTYSNAWKSLYGNLSVLSDVITACSQGGKEEGRNFELGVAKILTAYNLSVLTDLMGDVPWSEALKPLLIVQPKLDKQKDIYNTIFSLLQEAIDDLEAAGNQNIGKQDIYYDGDASDWTRLAYGLLARYTLRLSHKNEAYEQVINYAIHSFVSRDEECKLDYSTISGKSPFYALFSDVDFLGASYSLNDKLYFMNDPRFDYLWKAHPRNATGELLFAYNGDPDRNQKKQEVFGISANMHEYAPSYIMSFHELEFIKAEAYVRSNEVDKAREALIVGVHAAFQKVAYAFNMTEAEITTLADAYIKDKVLDRFDTNPLQEIMLQKYIAGFEEEAIETYADLRRLKAMGGDNATYIELYHPSPNKFPLRFTYGDTDVTTNKYVRNEFERLKDKIYEENVWWASND